MTKKTFIKEIDPYIELHRDPKTGIAWVEDGRSGNGHSAHPNIDASGSVIGMKSKGYWGKDDRVVRSHGYIYNIDRIVISDGLDRIANDNCQCAGKHAAYGTLYIHLATKKDTNGNPRRLFLVLDSNGNPIEAIEEGYAGTSVVRQFHPNAVAGPRIEVPISEYNDWKRWKNAKISGRKS